MSTTETRRWRATAAAMLLALTSLAGCNDADTVLGSNGEQIKATDAEYCYRAVLMESFPGPQLDMPAPAPEEQATVLKAYGAALLAQAQARGQKAPDEIQSDVDLLTQAVAQVSETGDLSVLEDPAVREAKDRVHGYELEHCGWLKTDVVGTEYAFGGVLPALPPGVNTLELHNEGREVHEMVLLRFADGVEETLPQILALPQTELFNKLRGQGATRAGPGQSGHVVADLVPGRYALVCFLPVGTTGPPHFTRGMQLTFAVN